MTVHGISSPEDYPPLRWLLGTLAYIHNALINGKKYVSYTLCMYT